MLGSKILKNCFYGGKRVTTAYLGTERVCETEIVFKIIIDIVDPNYSPQNVVGGRIHVTDIGNGQVELTSFDSITSIELHEKGDSSEITAVEVVFFDTVTSCDNMFRYLKKCTSITFPNNWNTTKVNEMDHMFHDCQSLTTLDLTNLNTSSVTRMEGMFHGCTSLTSLNLTSFNTENVYDFREMFKLCSSLLDVDLSSFDTKKVTSTGNMFNGCSRLVGIDLSSFESVVMDHMQSMFNGCTALKCLSNLDTTNAVDTDFIFDGCTNLLAPSAAEIVLLTDTGGDNWVGDYTCPIISPVIIGDFMATEDRYDEIELSWTQSPGETYDLYRDGVKIKTNLTSPIVLSIADTDVYTAETYYIKTITLGSLANSNNCNGVAYERVIEITDFKATDGTLVHEIEITFTEQPSPIP